MTTVEYGDRFPVTGTGRLVAVGLMVAGIALLGVVTATLASWLVERVSEEAEAHRIGSPARSPRCATRGHGCPHSSRTGTART